MTRKPKKASSHKGRSKGRSSSTETGERRTQGLFTEAELDELDRRHQRGVSAVEVVELFTARGVRLSEATFRKYVQQGLVPRSRRVGRKGKHRGSMGLYPAKTIRRINRLKQLMEEGYTIEEIQEHFLRFADLIEGVDEGLSELFESFTEAIEEPHFDARAKKSLQREIEETRKLATELMTRVGGLAETVAEPPRDRYRSSGAAGSAEELL